MTSIRLIILDLDDTLWPGSPTILAAEKAMFDWLRTYAHRVTRTHDIDSLRRHRMALREASPDIAHDLTAIRLASLRELMTEYHYPRDLADRCLEGFRQYRNRVEPYADVAPVLARLRENFLLVSLTNGNAQVARTPLKGLFHKSFMAEEVGVAKPDSSMFAAVLAWSGVGPDKALHVGDDPRLDVVAAVDFGLHAAWMNRHGAVWPEGLPKLGLEFGDMWDLAGWLSPM